MGLCRGSIVSAMPMLLNMKRGFFSWLKKKIRGYFVDQIDYADNGNAAKVLTPVERRRWAMALVYAQK